MLVDDIHGHVRLHPGPNSASFRIPRLDVSCSLLSVYAAP